MPITDTLKKIQGNAADFENTAHLVNESSRQRKKYTGEAISCLDMVIDTGNTLLKEMKQISGQAVLLSNRHMEALNALIILKRNIHKQNSIIHSFSENSSREKEIIDPLAALNRNLDGSVLKGISLFEKLIDKTNDIILLDSQLLNLKKFQNKKNLLLKRLAQIALKDADKSIENSDANHQRGSDFIKSLSQINDLIKSSDRNGIEAIIGTAAAGRKSASMVNISSKAQFVFTDRVNLAANQLFTGSMRIREMIQEKYRSFNENLETVTEISILMSLELLDYLPAKALFKQMLADDISSAAGFPPEMDDLSALVISACDDIESLSGLNFDMTENISMNSRLEASAIALTANEMESYNALKTAVEFMTEAARYPVEGSARNMDNAREIERGLKAVLSLLK
jgi:hypothetical protein